MQSRINHLVGPTHFTTLGPPGKRGAEGAEIFGVSREGDGEGCPRPKPLPKTDFGEIELEKYI